jgi:hypothetical protein
MGNLWFVPSRKAKRMSAAECKSDTILRGGATTDKRFTAFHDDESRAQGATRIGATPPPAQGASRIGATRPAQGDAWAIACRPFGAPEGDTL